MRSEMHSAAVSAGFLFASELLDQVDQELISYHIIKSKDVLSNAWAVGLTG